MTDQTSLLTKVEMGHAAMLGRLGIALSARNRFTRRAIYRDSYHPSRRWQRGQTPGAAGWVLRTPRGSLWLMLLGQRPSGWVHGRG